MATIIKRKKKYSVVYYFEDEKGEKKQKISYMISSKFMTVLTGHYLPTSQIVH